MQKGDGEVFKLSDVGFRGIAEGLKGNSSVTKVDVVMSVS
jgi:hypothetical protein